MDGITTTALTGVPTNVDLSKLDLYQTSDKVGIGQAVSAVRDTALRFAALDWPGQEECAALLSYLVAPSADAVIKWRVGNLDAQDVSRDLLGQANRQRRTRAASQVPDKRALVPLGGYDWEVTRPGVNGISSDEIAADIMAAQEALINSVMPELMRAIFYSAERDVVGSTTGNGVGWVGGTGQGYVPGRKKGDAFSGHTHYVYAADSEAGRRALFAAQYATLTEHGRNHSAGAPLLLIHGSTTLADVKADDYYQAPTVVGVQPGQDTAVVTDVPFWAHGKLTDCGAWCVNVGSWVPDNYFAMVKSYGPLNVRNPIRLFYPADYGFGPVIIDDRTNFPLDANTAIDAGLLNAMCLWLQYGLTVRDPEAGTAGYITSGSAYSDPTI